VDADAVICMEGGKCAGCGTHLELLDSCGEYQRLWNTQKELESFGREAAL
jgi:ABC-type transport system involved in Fe-S cluster assembly fused permease/ATPase subunit